MIALLLLACQDIDALLEQLDAEGIEARAEAADALVKIGEKALLKLRERKSAEAEAVIRRIEADIRRKGFKGGKTVAGLEMRVSTKTTEVVRGAKIEVLLEVMNVDEVERPFVPIRGWNHEDPGSSSSSTSSHARRVLRQTAGKRPDRVGGRIG